MSISNQCFPVSNSNVFPEYNDLSIAEFSTGNRIINNQSTLEEYFRLSRKINSSISKALNCNNMDLNQIYQIRYFHSSYFVLSVMSPRFEQCQNVNPTPKLCRNVVETSQRTLMEYMTKNGCVETLGIGNRMKQFLDNTTTDSTECIPGLWMDKKQCGMLSFL
jgi:hypothetical protein